MFETEFEPKIFAGNITGLNMKKLKYHCSHMICMCYFLINTLLVTRKLPNYLHKWIHGHRRVYLQIIFRFTTVISKRILVERLTMLNMSVSSRTNFVYSKKRKQVVAFPMIITATIWWVRDVRNHMRLMNTECRSNNLYYNTWSI